MTTDKTINPFSTKVREFATLFDNAFENCDIIQTEKLIGKAEIFVETHKTFEYAPLFYSLGTAYGDLMKFKKIIRNEMYEEKQIYYFRFCMKLLEDKELQKEEYFPFVLSLKIQLLTNYANVLDHCGRKILAIKFYREVLNIHNNFMLARGNMGISLLYYSKLLHNEIQSHYLNYFAYNFLKEAYNDNTGSVHSSAKMYFKDAMNNYCDDYINEFLNKELTIPNSHLGYKEEKDYREWCLKNHLFLSPLNDLVIEHPNFAEDVLTLPPMVTKLASFKPPVYFYLFNQIKQEYIYARYLCFKGQSYNAKIHYADKNTYLIDTYDFSLFSIRIEEIKTSFRLAYSLFDKVAFFINSYWKLGIKERDISFSSIWLKTSGRGKNKYTHKKLLNTDSNVALQSIKWIYKDFKETFGDLKEPEAKKINSLRNSLEHKFIKVYDDLSDDNVQGNDDGIYNISESDLVYLTIELLEMVRELIIDLTMAVHINESNKNISEKIISKNVMEVYKDEWKF